jgi:hypothetical protein
VGRLEHLGRAAILGGLALTLGNEILGWFRALRFLPVTLLWICVISAVIGCVLNRNRRSSLDKAEPVEEEAGWLARSIRPFLFGLAAYVLVAALWSPPNTWDSMVFHLPRQIRWIQQGSLEHFPTHVLHQLFRGPLAEIWQANLQIIFGADHATKLVSVLSWALVGLFAYLVAAGWGAHTTACRLASWLALTIPIGFLGSLTTKNDLMVTAWVLATVWLAQKAYRGEFGAREAFLCGAAAGMAGLTKATGWFFLLGLSPWLVHSLWRLRRRYLYAALFVVPVVLLNAGHWSRNLAVFGEPLYFRRDLSMHPNQSLTFGRVVSRLVKESAFHLATPWDAGNRWIEQWILELHHAMDLDILDPDTTYPERSFSVRFRPYSESEAGSPLHFGFVVLLPALGWWVRARGPSALFLWSWAPGVVFVWTALFTRWEPFLNPRLHLTCFALGASLLPPLAWASERTGDRSRDRGRSKRLSGSFLPAVLFVGCLLQLVPTLYWSPRALQNQMRTDPAGWQFQQGGDLAAPYQAAITLVSSRSPAVVGLDSRGHPWGWEYPLMRGLLRDLWIPRFVAVNVTNVSRRLESGREPLPDLVIALRPVEKLEWETRGVRFRRLAVFDFLTVLEREEEGPELEESRSPAGVPGNSDPGLQ